MHLEQFVYASRAIKPRGDLSDLEILEEAISHNQKVGLTGFLLRGHDFFCQALEGPAEAINALLPRLIADPRHVITHQWPMLWVTHRQFANWDMGFMPLAANSEALLREMLTNGSKAGGRRLIDHISDVAFAHGRPSNSR